MPFSSLIGSRHGAPAGLFTRLELLLVLACLGLLAGLGLPTVANTGQSSDQAWCANNLRLVGRAIHLWGADHQNLTPWRIPLADGGTQRSGKAGAAWYEFSFVSNQMVTPRILVCPSDTKRVATDFSTRADGGFLNAGYRNNALSYWVGLDAGYGYGRLLSFDNSPGHALSGDRNLSVNGLNVGCSTGVNNASSINARPVQSMTSSWTNGIHGRYGNVLLNDGRVLWTSTLSMRETLSTGDDNGNIHLLIP